MDSRITALRDNVIKVIGGVKLPVIKPPEKEPDHHEKAYNPPWLWDQDNKGGNEHVKKDFMKEPGKKKTERPEYGVRQLPQYSHWQVYGCKRNGAEKGNQHQVAGFEPVHYLL